MVKSGPLESFISSGVSITQSINLPLIIENREGVPLWLEQERVHCPHSQHVEHQSQHWAPLQDWSDQVWQGVICKSEYSSKLLPSGIDCCEFDKRQLSWSHFDLLKSFSSRGWNQNQRSVLSHKRWLTWPNVLFMLLSDLSATIGIVDLSFVSVADLWFSYNSKCGISRFHLVKLTN